MVEDRVAEIQQRRRQALQQRREEAKKPWRDPTLMGDSLNLVSDKGMSLGRWVYYSFIKLCIGVGLISGVFIGQALIADGVRDDTQFAYSAIGLGTVIIILCAVFALLYGLKKSIEDKLERYLDQKVND